MSEDSLRGRLERPLTRRQVLHGALVGGAMLGTSGLLSACGGSISPAVLLPPPIEPIKSGGSIRIGATGGGAKDTIDAHLPTADTDIMRNWNLYESLASRPADFGPLEMLVATSIEPEHKVPDSWIVKLRPGVEFHNGKTVDANDIVFSLQRIIDPKNPKVGATSIGYIDLARIKVLDPSTIRIRSSSRTRPSRTTSASTSTRSSRSATTPRSRSAPAPSCSTASAPASRAFSSASRTTGSTRSPTSTS